MKPSHGPDGVLAFMHLVVCVQGGGVYIEGGTTTFTNVNIHDNQADYVCYRLSKPSHRPSHRPDGVLAFL